MTLISAGVLKGSENVIDRCDVRYLQLDPSSEACQQTPFFIFMQHRPSPARILNFRYILEYNSLDFFIVTPTRRSFWLFISHNKDDSCRKTLFVTRSISNSIVFYTLSFSSNFRVPSPFFRSRPFVVLDYRHEQGVKFETRSFFLDVCSIPK